MRGLGVDRARAALARRPALTAAVVSGLLVRALWCVVAARAPQAFGDPFSYLAHAEDLASAKGYVTYYWGEPTAYYPPGYPLLLGALLWVARLVRDATSAFDVAIAANLVAGAATVVWTHGAARRTLGERAATVAGFVVALWPGLVLYSATAHLETVFVAVVALVASLLARLADQRRPSVTALAALGVVLGAAVLVRPIIGPAGLLAVLVAWRGWKAAARDAAIVAGAAAAVILPWSIRSTSALGAPVLVSTNTGDNLCVGHSSFSDGGYLDLSTHCWPEPDARGTDVEVERDREGRRAALRYAVEHPGRELWLLGQKAWRMVEHDHEGILAVESYGADRFMPDWLRASLRWLADAWWLGSAPAVVAGAVLLWRGRGRGGPALVLLGATLLTVPLLFFGGSRFHVPAVPVLAICVGAAVAAVVDRDVDGRPGWAPARGRRYRRSSEGARR